MSLEPITTLLAARHRRALANPESAQRALLRRLLAQCHEGAVATSLGLTRDMSFDEFLDVSPRDHSSYASLVEQAFQGGLHTFGRDPVVAFGETSGSLGPPKLIPHTAASLNAIERSRSMDQTRGHDAWRSRVPGSVSRRSVSAGTGRVGADAYWRVLAGAVNSVRVVTSTVYPSRANRVCRN